MRCAHIQSEHVWDPHEAERMLEQSAIASAQGVEVLAADPCNTSAVHALLLQDTYSHVIYAGACTVHTLFQLIFPPR